jgi:hypothetical protein
LHIDIQFSSNIFWGGCFCSIICFEHLCQKSGGESWVNLYPGLLFFFIGLHVCFCANTVLFLLLWFCSIVWSEMLWYFQHCSFLLIIALAIHMNFRVDF